MPRLKQEGNVVLASRISSNHRRRLRIWAANKEKGIGVALEMAIDILIAAHPIEETANAE
jgi:hypothetical protein